VHVTHRVLPADNIMAADQTVAADQKPLQPGPLREDRRRDRLLRPRVTPYSVSETEPATVSVTVKPA